MQPRRLEHMVCLFLIVATLTVYWQVRNHDFVNYDDDKYVTKNPHVQAGVSREGIIWAFTTTHASNWHPLTWLSHMLDCQLYGLNPEGHHLTNLLLHIANTLLLFLVLKRMTEALWRSAIVAALFALHPLHVESVAWVAERKDVLSTFFFMTTMWAYVRYVECPRLGRYVLVAFSFSLGLIAKPMLVTLPFVLLLMDYWPLGRLELRPSTVPINIQTQHSKYPACQDSRALPLLWEKAPFFVLAAVSAVVTIVVQRAGGSLSSLEMFPLTIRVANALVSYLSYIGKMIWPMHLAVFYPHPGMRPVWQAAGAGLLLLCVSVAVIRAAQRAPYLAVGWLWYLGTLIPVIGVVQVGAQAMADRYTYVPLIGVFVMIGWGLRDLVSRWDHLGAVVPGCVGVIFAALMICTWLQVSRWNNSISLFEHTLDITVDNNLAHYNLGIVLAERGRLEEAIGHFSEALRIKPDDAEAHNNLGIALAERGRLEEAMGHFSEALRIKPDYAEPHYNLGIALALQRRRQEAMHHFSVAVKLKPDYAEAHLNLGAVIASQGRLQQAVDHFAEALRIKPDFAKAKHYLEQAIEDIRKQKTVSNSLPGE
jgi:tetratricopeptide (TPR) repeat protein